MTGNSEVVRMAQPRIRRYRRRGVGYVYFLSCMLLVSVIGMSAMLAARVRLKLTLAAADGTAVRFLAQSAIELGYALMDADVDWRSNRGTGAWFTDMPIGDGKMTLTVTIVDDGVRNFQGDPNILDDNVVMVGEGAQGQSKHRIQVELGAASDKGGTIITGGSGKRTGG
jgi:hypothetical protein